MLHQQLSDAWQARERAVPIVAVLHFTAEGLVLGAGTVLLPADGARCLKGLQGHEARLLALLSVAYGRAVPPAVLGNIERAAKAWGEGDDCLAYIHLAHAGLREPPDPRDAAHRLFIADSFMKAGTSPRAVFEALCLSPAYIEAVEKAYNPDQPRVPAGSGRASGQWTSEPGGDEQSAREPEAATEAARRASGGGSPAAAERTTSGRALAFLPPLAGAAVEAAPVLATLSRAAAVALGAYAAAILSRAGGVAAAISGLLFIPSPNKIKVEGEVPDIPGLSYSWNRDETLLHLTYDGPDGSRQTFTAQLQDDVFRDQRGQVVGRVLPRGNIVIIPPPRDPANDNNPRLCPQMGPDKGGERGRDYADYVKSVVNPPPNIPTPRYFGFQLPNPYNFGRLVYYDDCEHATGTMIEAKGPGYAHLLQFPWGMASLVEEWIGESGGQLSASHGRSVRWYFAEPAAAAFARALFSAANQGREKIQIVVLPWLKVLPRSGNK